VHIESEDARIFVTGGNGDLAVDLANGQARIHDFSGALTARGDAAKWDISAAAPADLNLPSKNGPVGVFWKGGAKVFLTSTQGTIDVLPNGFLKSGDRDGHKVVEGRRPAKAMGQVFVRTDNGPIRWRQ
jgi:hypothetical protein